MSNKFGWHSGTLTCQNIECLGDVKIQDDIIFSDVSAGRLGVTGGIDMSETESAIGIDMGGTFSTTAINIDGTTNKSIVIAISPTATGAGNDPNNAGIDINCTTAAGTGSAFGTESVVTIGADFTGTACVYCGVHGHANAVGAYTVGNNSLMGGFFEITLPAGNKTSMWNWGLNVKCNASANEASNSGALYGIFIDMDMPTTGTWGREHAIHIWQHGTIALDNLIAFEGTSTTGINFAFGTATMTTGINMGDNCTTGIQLGDATTGILLDGDYTTAINIEGTGNTYERAIMVGAFGEDDNLIVDTTNNYPVGVFAKITEDCAPTADIRSAWFRLRVNTTVQVGTSANWGSSLRGIQGSLKFYGGSGTGTYCWCNAGVFGSIETDGATKIAFRDGSVTGALFAHVGLLATSADDVDIETGAVVAGVAINTGTNKASDGVTVDGHFCGMYIYNDSGYQSFKYGIFIDDPAIQHAVMIGESGTGSMTITQTNRYPLGVFGRIEGAISSGLETMRCIRARMQIDANVSSGASVYPIQAYNVISENTVTWGTGAGSNLFGVMAGMETSGSTLIINGWAGGVVSYLSAATGWADANSSCIITGFLALSNMHDTCTINGVYAAFTAYKYAGKEPWTYGIYMANDAATHVMGFSDGTGLADANGMTGTKTVTQLSHWDGWIRIDIGGADHYIPTCLNPAASS